MLMTLKEKKKKKYKTGAGNSETFTCYEQMQVLDAEAILMIR